MSMLVEIPPLLSCVLCLLGVKSPSLLLKKLIPKRVAILYVHAISDSTFAVLCAVFVRSQVSNGGGANADPQRS
jgi:hypothetical protein